MKNIFCFISDTHTRHNSIKNMIIDSLKKHNVENGFCIICTGDCMSSGYQLDELLDFIKWFTQLPFLYKIFVPGNHDRYLESAGHEFSKNMFEKYYDEGVRYLHNEGCEIEDKNGLKYSLWGTADQPTFCNWAFNRTTEELNISYSQIPENLDFLCSHCPCFNILDKSHIKTYRNPTGEESLGSKELLKAVNKVNPRYHCFGHIHGDGGKMETIGSTTYINASVCNEAYQPINKIITLEIESKHNEVEN